MSIWASLGLAVGLWPTCVERMLGWRVMNWSGRGCDEMEEQPACPLSIVPILRCDLW